MNMSIDHIGLVCEEPEVYAHILEQYGGRIIASGVANEFGVECFFVDMGNIIIELITPLEDNKIKKFMNENKSCLHHIAIDVDKLDNAKQGAIPNMKVNFKLNEKLLIEEVKYE